jgi:hypothetical protein
VTTFSAIPAIPTYIQERTPGLVTQRGCSFRRADDVSEQRGGEDAIDLDSRPFTGQELTDLLYRSGRRRQEEIGSRSLDEPCPVDVVGQGTSLLEADASASQTGRWSLCALIPDRPRLISFAQNVPGDALPNARGDAVSRLCGRRCWLSLTGQGSEGVPAPRVAVRANGARADARRAREGSYSGQGALVAAPVRVGRVSLVA